MLDARFLRLYFCQSLHTLQQQHGWAAIADLLVMQNHSFSELTVTLYHTYKYNHPESL